MQSVRSLNSETAKARFEEPKRPVLSEAGATGISIGGRFKPSAASMREELEREAKRHDCSRHRFNEKLLAGRCSSEEIRCFAVNVYYYETCVPNAHALILAKSDDAAFRRRWLGKIVEHDDEEHGTLALCQRFVEATGIERTALEGSTSGLPGVIPGVRFAADAFLAFMREASLREALAAWVADSYARELAVCRLVAFEHHYGWVASSALGYLREGGRRAAENAKDALQELSGTPCMNGERPLALRAVIRKAQLAWHVLDCIDGAMR